MLFGELAEGAVPLRHEIRNIYSDFGSICSLQCDQNGHNYQSSHQTWRHHYRDYDKNGRIV